MLTLGVIGDFGVNSKNSVAVANLVKSWSPNYILTVGDNLYSQLTEANYSLVVGSLYKEFLCSKDAKDRILKPSKELRITSNDTKKCINYSAKFLPCVGNHDYPFGAYVNYFGLPTYYAAEFLHPKENMVKVISLNSTHESRTDGKFNSVKVESRQRSWLENELEKSAHFKWIIITFHHPQICSNNSEQENEKHLFPFHEYKNVALILCGHQHIYERLELNGIPNIVVGTSGHTIRRKNDIVLQESKCLDNSGFGALRLKISWDRIEGTYYVLEKKISGVKLQSVDSIKDEFVISDEQERQ